MLLLTCGKVLRLVAHGMDLSRNRGFIRGRLGHWPQIHRGVHTALAQLVDCCKHAGEHLVAWTRPEDTPSRYGLCGLDGHWGSGDRRSWNISVRRARNGAPPLKYQPDFIRNYWIEVAHLRLRVEEQGGRP